MNLFSETQCCSRSASLSLRATFRPIEHQEGRIWSISYIWSYESEPFPPPHPPHQISQIIIVKNYSMMNSNTNIINGLKTNQLAHSVCHGILIEQVKYFSGLRTVIQKLHKNLVVALHFVPRKYSFLNFTPTKKWKK